MAASRTRPGSQGEAKDTAPERKHTAQSPTVVAYVETTHETTLEQQNKVVLAKQVLCILS